MTFLNSLFGKSRNHVRPQGWHASDNSVKPSPARPAAKRAEAASEHPAPGTQIAYDPDLVQRLKADHKQLLELFGKISAAFAQNNLPLTAQFLDDFRSRIQAHLLTENIRFYIYLEHSLTSDMASSALVHEFRQEMDGIGQAMLEFLNKYKEIATRPDFAIPFGKVLVDRIKREEDTLYPLYFRVY